MQWTIVQLSPEPLKWVKADRAQYVWSSSGSITNHCGDNLVNMITLIILNVMTEVGRSRRRSFVTHLSQSYFSRTVWPRNTKFHTNLYTDTVHTYTGYDVANYFQSEVILKKSSKIPPPTASGGISGETFKRWSQNFRGLSGTIGPTNLPD